MSHIFISYRRSDSSSISGRVFDHLSRRFGAASLFRDIDSIHAGEDFRKAITTAVSRCHVFVAVIGEEWLDVRDETGERRIQNANDYVHIEIRTALERGVTVVPVLIDGAEMPRAESLPEPIRELAFRNSLPVRSGLDFQGDIERLCNELETLLPVKKKSFGRLSVLLPSIAILLLGLIAVAFLFPPDSNTPTLSVGIKQWVGYTPLAVASELGLFGKGVEIKYVDVETVEEMHEQLKNDSIDIAMVLVDTHARKCETIRAMEIGGNTPVAFLKIDTSRGADGIIAHRDVRSVLDLGEHDGIVRRFYYQNHDVSHFLLKVLCRSADIRFWDLKGFGDSVSPEAAAELFAKEGESESRRHFATGTYDPYLSRILDPGDKEYYVENAVLLIDSDDERVKGQVIDIMIAKRRLLQTRAESVKSLVEGWFQAVDILNNPGNPHYGRACEIARRFNGLPKDGASWRWRNWRENEPCNEKAFAEMIDGLRGRRRSEEKKEPAWASRKENLEFFERQGRLSSGFDKAFADCHTLQERGLNEPLDATRYEAAKLVLEELN